MPSKNFKILPNRYNPFELTEYFDPESRLNCRVLDKKQIADGIALVVGLMSENDQSIYIGYDFLICRNGKLPKTEEWGVWGWSWLKYESARKQFEGTD